MHQFSLALLILATGGGAQARRSDFLPRHRVPRHAWALRGFRRAAGRQTFP
jgi:hypothetical protein